MQISAVKTNIRRVCHLFGGAVCAGAILLIAASAPAQNLFVADSGSGKIYEFTPNGGSSTFASGLNDPTAVAFDSSGNLYVANYGDNTVTKIAPLGTMSTVVSGLTKPYNGLAINSAGNLFVSSWSGYGSGYITEVTPQGAASTFASGGFSGPEGLAFNSAGNLFVANQQGYTINEITPQGTVTSFAYAINTP